MGGQGGVAYVTEGPIDVSWAPEALGVQTCVTAVGEMELTDMSSVSLFVELNHFEDVSNVIADAIYWLYLVDVQTDERDQVLSASASYFGLYTVDTTYSVADFGGPGVHRIDACFTCNTLSCMTNVTEVTANGYFVVN